MANAAPTFRRDTLILEPNVEHELVLKFPTGKQISNGNIMFTTMTDQVLFLKPEDAQKIHALGLNTNEPFTIVKRNGKVIASRVNGQQTGGTMTSTPPPTATAIPEPIGAAQASQPQNNSYSRVMASSYIAAIDALMLAEQYATSKGVPFRMSMGEIRASAHCIYISASRNMGVR